MKTRSITTGVNSSAIYLEADNEISLAAYFAEFADIMGKGSAELVERLIPAVADQSERERDSKELLPAPLLKILDPQAALEELLQVGVIAPDRARHARQGQVELGDASGDQLADMIHRENPLRRPL